jgi:hypothetical protein
MKTTKAQYQQGSIRKVPKHLSGLQEHGEWKSEQAAVFGEKRGILGQKRLVLG